MSRVIGIFGMGNVAGDLARIFLKNPDDLEETNIDHQFLDYLRKEGPEIVRIFSRSHPSDCKIGLKELEELQKLGIWMSASFNPELIRRNLLDEEQQKLLDFFTKIRDQKLPKDDIKRLHFHFQLKLKEFRQVGKVVEAVLVDRDKQEVIFRAKNFITAIGRTPVVYEEKPPYVTGWATGKGGTLALAEASAKQTTLQIVEDFRKGIFNHKMAAPKNQPWMLRAVGNQAYLNILNWVRDGNKLITVEDFEKAKNYHQSVSVNPQPVSPVLAAPQKTHAPDPTSVTVYEYGSDVPIKIPSGTTGSLLTALKAKLGDKAPKHECDGRGTCGACVVTVDTPVELSKKEKSLVKAHGHNPKTDIISCGHEASKFVGSVVRMKR